MGTTKKKATKTKADGPSTPKAQGSKKKELAPAEQVKADAAAKLKRENALTAARRKKAVAKKKADAEAADTCRARLRSDTVRPTEPARARRNALRLEICT